MSRNLVIRAGPEALRQLRQGWDWKLFDVVVGASGAAKWLVLGALDRLLVDLLADSQRARPIHLLGASSGAWRMMAYCQADPSRALDLLEQAYIDADWNHDRPLNERGQSARGILQAYAVGHEQHVLEQKNFRLHIVTAHCRGPLTLESPPLQIVGLLITAMLMAWKRPAMAAVVRRALFSDPRDPLPSALDDVRTQRWPLRPDNLQQALLASGSIPLVLPAVRDVPGGPAGCLRDGGLVDYHFDHVCLEPPGLVLYPHFAERIMPSWLENFHPTPPVDPRVMDRMVMLHPHPDWLAKLPGGKIPDRIDGKTLSPQERCRRWRETARRSQDLAEDLSEVIRQGRFLPL